MNRRLVVRLEGAILLLEVIMMLPSLLIALHFGEGDAPAFLKTMGLLVLVGFPMWFFAKPDQRNMRAKDGLAAVALAWILMSFFGALPFIFSGMIPNVADALFESISGFTTTGATIMTQIDGQPHGLLFWRAFTHWIGGMGVLVLTLALLPQMTGRTSYLVKAESPGPSLSKLVPKMGDMAKILYILYAALTVLETVALLLAGLSPYDAILHAMSTAGTGGFSNYGASIAHYNSAAVDIIITVFMVLFGINFALYYRLLFHSVKDALKSEELRWHLCIFVVATLAISLLILPQYGNNLGTALRYGSFQVASVASTTGFATANFDLWPQAAKMILLFLLFVGSCAGSTAGGLKVSRVILLVKMGRREILHTFQPRKTQVVRMEGKGVEEQMLSQVALFFFAYLALILVGAFLISLENSFNFESNLTAAITCMSNVGPGFGMLGPAGTFAPYSAFSKIVCTFLMLAGRLEIYPILVLFHPAVWKQQ